MLESEAQIHKTSHYKVVCWEFLGQWKYSNTIELWMYVTIHLSKP